MRAKRINRQLREKTNRRKTNMKKIFAIALALMLAIPALAFADGNDVQIVVQGAAEVTAAPDILHDV